MMQPKLRIKTDVFIPRSITALILLSVGIAAVLILSWQYPKGIGNNLVLDQASPDDITAPAEITYTSQILTSRAAENAAEAVDPIYDRQDSRIRQQQMLRASEALDFVSLVLTDQYADTELRTDYLLAVTEPNLSAEIVDQILSLTANEWDKIVAEVPQTVGLIMDQEIQDNVSAISKAKRDVLSLIDPDMSETVSNITTALTRDLIQPNSFYNEQKTAELRQQARATIQPITKRFKRGESIIRRGEIVIAEDIEALEQSGLARNEWTWWILLQAALFTTAIIGLITLAVNRFLPQIGSSSNNQIAFLALAAVFWLFAAKLMVTRTGTNEWLTYLYPLAALSMLVTLLVDLKVGIIFTMAFGLVVLYMSRTSSELATMLVLSGLVGAFTLRKTDRLISFLWSSLAIIFCNLFIYLTFNIPLTFPLQSNERYDLIAACLNGVLSTSIALISYFILGNIFGFTTSLELTELSRPTHPLLRQLLLKSPGTYHHTIVVSNLAERAAAAIGANELLTRVGAYYHDIGKTVRPYFFIENSAEGAENPHEKLEPHTSAQIIISHVSDGLDLAQKYKLPNRIRDFIREHHGTSLVHYFHQQAIEQVAEGETVDSEEFRYGGPKPQTKETAILSLADMCESAIRAIRPSTRAELAKIVDRLIDERVDAGELNESDLTFKELHVIKGVFVQVLQGVHHPRITYPSKDEAVATIPTLSNKEEPKADLAEPVTPPASKPKAKQEAKQEAKKEPKKEPKKEKPAIERISVAVSIPSATTSQPEPTNLPESEVVGGVEQPA